MRHRKWKIIDIWLQQIEKNIGNFVYDKRCGKSWDAGQAVCAEAYGPNWSRSAIFREWDQKDDSEPPEPLYYDVAGEMAAGYIPDWVQR
jgi:hypothetical protein